jgi:hypothetical protein
MPNELTLNDIPLGSEQFYDEYEYQQFIGGLRRNMNQNEVRRRRGLFGIRPPMGRPAYGGGGVGQTVVGNYGGYNFPRMAGGLSTGVPVQQIPADRSTPIVVPPVMDAVTPSDIMPSDMPEMQQRPTRVAFPKSLREGAQLAQRGVRGVGSWVGNVGRAVLSPLSPLTKRFMRRSPEDMKLITAAAKEIWDSKQGESWSSALERAESYLTKQGIIERRKFMMLGADGTVVGYEYVADVDDEDVLTDDYGQFEGTFADDYSYENDEYGQFEGQYYDDSDTYMNY